MSSVWCVKNDIIYEDILSSISSKASLRDEIYSQFSIDISLCFLHKYFYFKIVFSSSIDFFSFENTLTFYTENYIMKFLIYNKNI